MSVNFAYSTENSDTVYVVNNVVADGKLRKTVDFLTVFGLFMLFLFGRISSLFDLILEKASKTLDNIE